MAKKHKRGGLNIYKSYNFVDKDPVIDMVRTAIQLSNKSYKQIAEKGGPSVSTQYAWFDGKTRRPQFCTTAAALRASGGDVLIKLPNGRVQRI